MCRNSLFLAILAVVAAFPGCSCTPQPNVASANHETLENANTSTSEDIKRNGEVTPKKSLVTSAENTEATPNLPELKGREFAGNEPTKVEIAGQDKGTGRSVSITGALFGGAERKAAERSSPQEAYDQASKLAKAATELAKNGKMDEAFAKATAAWQVARGHQKDPACAGLCESLESLLSRLGESLNDSISRSRVSGKPVQIE